MAAPFAVRTEVPELSVVILTHNRVELLRRSLRSVLAQRFEGLEVVVVDNGSSDDTESVVKHDFPQVRLIRLEENSGIRGRNVGFEAARAPIVLSLDDDIELIATDSLARLKQRFEASGKLGALSLMICEEPAMNDFVPHHWWHPASRETSQHLEFPTEHINEAAVAFRAAALTQSGGYYERFFWGAEEWDLVLGILDAGFDVHYFPLPVRHLAPRGSLNTRADPRHAQLVRNRCWTACRRLPWPSALFFSIPRLALWAGRALRHGYFGAYLSGLASLVRAFPTLLRERRPISKETRARLVRIRAQRRGALLTAGQ